MASAFGVRGKVIQSNAYEYIGQCTVLDFL